MGKDDFAFLVILPSRSKLCQSSKRQCGFVSPHATCCFWVVFFLSSFSLLVCLCLSQSAPVCSCDVLFFVLLFVCFFVLVLCLLFLFFVLTVWWFVLFPKRLRVGIQRQWGKNTCEDCQKDWLYWPILGVIVFFLPYRVGGLGKRGGMVLLHVNDPPIFTTPSENMPKQPSSRGISIMSSESR